MSLEFYGKGNPVDQCPAVFVDPVTGRFFFQGETVTDPDLLAEIAEHSPMLPNESAVMLPPRMALIIMEAARAFLEANPHILQRPVEDVPPFRVEAGAP